MDEMQVGGFGTIRDERKVTLNVSVPKRTYLHVKDIGFGHVFATENGSIYLRLEDGYTALKIGLQCPWRQFEMIRRPEVASRLPPLEDIVADLGRLDIDICEKRVASETGDTEPAPSSTTMSRGEEVAESIVRIESETVLGSCIARFDASPFATIPVYTTRTVAKAARRRIALAIDKAFFDGVGWGAATMNDKCAKKAEFTEVGSLGNADDWRRKIVAAIRAVR